MRVGTFIEIHKRRMHHAVPRFYTNIHLEEKKIGKKSGQPFFISELVYQHLTIGSTLKRQQNINTYCFFLVLHRESSFQTNNFNYLLTIVFVNLFPVRCKCFFSVPTSLGSCEKIVSFLVLVSSSDLEILLTYFVYCHPFQVFNPF